MELNNSIIIQRIEEMYRKYGVDLEFLEALDEKQKLKGMKGVLVELELKKNGDYTSDDSLFIKEVYSMFC